MAVVQRIPNAHPSRTNNKPNKPNKSRLGGGMHWRCEPARAKTVRQVPSRSCSPNEYGCLHNHSLCSNARWYGHAKFGRSQRQAEERLVPMVMCSDFDEERRQVSSCSSESNVQADRFAALGSPSLSRKMEDRIARRTRFWGPLRTTASLSRGRRHMFSNLKDSSVELARHLAARSWLPTSRCA